MVKKFTLETRPEPASFSITGIACHLKDYRLSFLINRQLKAEFRKTSDIAGKYSMYLYRDEESRNTYFLICNRGEDRFLFPEVKQADFLMLVEGPFKNTQQENLLKNLKEINNVLTAFEIRPASLKKFQEFLDDLERTIEKRS